MLIRGEVLASRVDSHLTSSVAVAPFPDRSGVIFSLVFFFFAPCLIAEPGESIFVSEQEYFLFLNSVA